MEGFTNAVENDKEMKNQKKKLKKRIRSRKIIISTNSKRNKFARIVTSKIVFNKYEHKEILNYFDKLLNDENVNYIIIYLDGEKKLLCNKSLSNRRG